MIHTIKILRRAKDGKTPLPSRIVLETSDQAEAITEYRSRVATMDPKFFTVVMLRTDQAVG